MIGQYAHKIKGEHFARKAVIYLRQSSERQVIENKESQRLQYAMADRARELGWKEVEVIDSDLGSSASIGAPKREGFERLIASVALGEVGAMALTNRGPPLLTKRDPLVHRPVWLVQHSFLLSKQWLPEAQGAWF